MSAPDIPSNYTVTTTLAGEVDVGLDNIRIEQLPTIVLETSIREIAPITTQSSVTTTNTVDLGLDNIRITELPRIDLQFGIKPTRIHFPLGIKFGVSVLGVELLSFDICGESMVVIEDYVPHHTEQCV